MFRSKFGHALWGQSLIPLRSFSTSTPKQADFTHTIIGGGAVGLAIARQLATRDGSSTLLIERNEAVGMETSSRNSEVIHAGLYYGTESLKTKLCIRGKLMLYELCNQYNIPHRKTGKWIVAQTDQQWEELVKVHKFSRLVDVPTGFIEIEEASRLEPYVQAKAGVLESPTTGIIDSHSYMQYLLGAFTDLGGDVAFNSSVTNIAPLPTSSSSATPGSAGYALTVRDQFTREESTIETETLINSAGLAACQISNMILPPSRHVTPFYAKGNYFSYSAAKPSTSRLIYPAPEPGLGGLGTHLTMDISGRTRFGPDVEWVDSPDDLSVNGARLPAAIKEIKKYLPAVDETKLQPDYAGIRPKLGKGSSVASVRPMIGGSAPKEKKDPSGKGGGIGGDGGGFLDFIIRKEEGYEGFVNLLGIESPGLTSSLAIGEMVEELLYE